MKIIEGSITFPLAIFVICALLVITISLFTNFYSDVKEKHEEVTNIYMESEEIVIREWDKLNEVIS